MPGHNNNNAEKMFTVSNGRERRLVGGLVVSLLGGCQVQFQNSHDDEDDDDDDDD